MASSKLTTLVVALTATTGPFASAMKGAEGLAKGAGERIKSALLDPFKALAAILTTGAIVEGIKRASERIDELAKASDRLGISTQSLAGLRHEAVLAGSSAEELGAGMEKLQRKIAEAAAGNKEAQKSFHDIKVSYAELSGMAADKQFEAVALAITHHGTAAQKTAAEMDIFGKSGARLGNILSDLARDGIGAATKEAKQLGLAVSRVDAAKVEEANDALTRVGEVFQGIFNQISVRLAPFVTAIATAFVDSAKEAGGFGGVIDKVVEGAVVGAGYVANAWLGLKVAWNAIAAGAEMAGSVILKMADVAGQAAQWIGTKFVQAWDVTKADAKLLGAALSEVWAAVKIPIAEFVQWTGSQLYTMLTDFASAAHALSPALAEALNAAAGKIAAGTGDAVQQAKQSLEVAQANTNQALAEDAQAWDNLFSSIETSGSETLQRMSANLDAAAEEHQQKIRDLAADSVTNGLPSERIQAAADAAQGEAQVRADARAKEIQTDQDQQNTLAQQQAIGLKRREEQVRDFYAITQTQGWKYTQQTLSGTSAMFQNLEALQNTHSKRAQQVGKAAAKAKIVVDTAAAAMASYQALAGIPYVGPYLGAAAAAAAIAAGAIQLANVDKSDGGTIGSGPSAPDQSTTNVGGVASPGNGQSLVLQGDTFSAQSLVDLFNQAKERGITIEGVRRG